MFREIQKRARLLCGLGSRVAYVYYCQEEFLSPDGYETGNSVIDYVSLLASAAGPFYTRLPQLSKV